MACPTWPDSPEAWERVRQVCSSYVQGVGEILAKWEVNDGRAQSQQERETRERSAAPDFSGVQER